MNQPVRVRRVLAGASVVALLGVLSLPAPAAELVRVSPAQIAALGIVTAPVLAARSGELAGLPAQVVVPNDQQRIVSAPLAGLVEQLLVATQQTVKRGQFLGRLQSSGLADIQHTYLQAVTQLELARSQLDRDQRLFDEGIIAESRLQAARARWVEMSADYAERTQALRLAGLGDAAMKALREGRRVGSAVDLAAPIDGVVLEQMVVVGQRVDAATPLLKIARLDPLWLEIQMPVAKLGGVREGVVVSVPEADAQARVVLVGRNINAANQTVTVRAVTTRGAQRLRPGQSLEVALAAGTGAGEWQVPAAALARSAGTATVYVQTEGGFRAQGVRVVSEAGEVAIVAGPLKPADRVVVKGVASLKGAAGGIGGG